MNDLQGIGNFLVRRMLSWCLLLIKTSTIIRGFSSNISEKGLIRTSK